MLIVAEVSASSALYALAEATPEPTIYAVCALGKPPREALPADPAIFPGRASLRAILDADSIAAPTALVEAGTVHATLQARAREIGLRFGPDPSSHSRCTVGGMIGNNACGNRALGYGRTSDNVTAMSLLTARGAALQATCSGIVRGYAIEISILAAGALSGISGLREFCQLATLIVERVEPEDPTDPDGRGDERSAETRGEETDR